MVCSTRLWRNVHKWHIALINCYFKIKLLQIRIDKYLQFHIHTYIVDFIHKLSLDIRYENLKKLPRDCTDLKCFLWTIEIVLWTHTRSTRNELRQINRSQNEKISKQ